MNHDDTFDDDIDLRPYIRNILRFWWLYILLGVVFGGLLYFNTSRKVDRYEATALVLVTRLRYDLELSKQFQTVREPIDIKTRTGAMVTLANNDSIAIDVAEKMNGLLPTRKIPTKFVSRAVKVINEGDILKVTANTMTPTLSAELANVWAEVVIKKINDSYTENLTVEEIQAQLDTSWKDYQSAQAELEEFINNNQIALLDKKISEMTSVNNSMADYRAWQIDMLYSRKKSLESLILKAQALKEQIRTGTSSEYASLGDAIALLKARAFEFVDGGSAPPEVAINIDTTQMDPVQDIEYMTSDLDRFIQHLEKEIAQTDSKLDDFTTRALDQAGYEEIEKVSAQLREYQSQLEAEKARQSELTSQRDLAWQAYQAIVQKKVEIENTGDTGAAVTLASEAITPIEPIEKDTLKNTAIGIAFGVVLGLIWAVGSEWWRSSNIFNDKKPEKTGS